MSDVKNDSERDASKFKDLAVKLYLESNFDSYNAVKNINLLLDIGDENDFIILSKLLTMPREKKPYYSGIKMWLREVLKEHRRQLEKLSFYSDLQGMMVNIFKNTMRVNIIGMTKGTKYGISMIMGITMDETDAKFLNDVLECIPDPFYFIYNEYMARSIGCAFEIEL